MNKIPHYSVKELHDRLAEVEWGNNESHFLLPHWLRDELLSHLSKRPVAYVYCLENECGPTFTANEDDPFVRAGRAKPLYD